MTVARIESRQKVRVLEAVVLQVLGQAALRERCLLVSLERRVVRLEVGMSRLRLLEELSLVTVIPPQTRRAGV